MISMHVPAEPDGLHPEALFAAMASDLQSAPAFGATPEIYGIDWPAPAETAGRRLFQDVTSCVDGMKAMLQRLGPGMAQSGLLTALEVKSPETYDHARRVTDIAAALGRAMGLCATEVRELRTAALFHDIGKVAIPAGVLEQSGPLCEHERAILRLHASIGADLVAQVPSLRAAAPVVAASHERYDGSGYPLGLAGQQIPLGARIIAVADAYDAMTARRPYGTPLSPAEATAELERCSGTHFAPEVVDAWTEMMPAVEGEKTVSRVSPRS